MLHTSVLAAVSSAITDKKERALRTLSEKTRRRFSVFSILGLGKLVLKAAMPVM